MESGLTDLGQTLAGLGFRRLAYSVSYGNAEGRHLIELRCTRPEPNADWIEPDPATLHRSARAARLSSPAVLWHETAELDWPQDALEAPRAGATVALEREGRFHAWVSFDTGAGRDGFAEAWDGAGDKALAAIELFRRDYRLAPVLRSHYGLTRREIVCLQGLLDGLQPKEIALAEGRSVFTVEKQLRSARERLGAATMVQAVAKAVMAGLI